ncbi:MAG: ABC-F family ATP-binding cassette domain-containing protein [Deltaproteobacteria bacterium]|nr:ABC-F family ATP-binding cassette domain-containing protein [Candidatus Anaeroferrophillus wilburensis]MBN2889640.1 ABC-F family ATP-binding cassette domain-containing protein [Deltaproteobacteria bacterium]
MISITELSKQYGGGYLFSKVNLRFDPGKRYGIVGANGAGKSTLLRLISGREAADHGEITVPGKVSVGTVNQDHFAFEDTTIMATVLQGQPVLAAALEEKEQLLQQTEPSPARLIELEEIIAHYDGYLAESRIAAMLEGLGIPAVKHQQPMRVLSGGYKLRVLLAQCLFGQPDVLLLDEPTNHLDIFSIHWLEEYLCSYAGVVLVVSHDRRFLNNVCTHIADIDYGTIKLYPGNYDQFLAAKAQDDLMRQQEAAKAEKRIDDLQQFVTRFKGKASKARQAQSKVKQIERLEKAIEAPVYSSRAYPLIAFTSRRPPGKVVLEVEGLQKSFGDLMVLDNVSFTVYRNDKIAILGPNGVGKSTLLKILMGQLQADGGTYSWGYKTYPDYFSQDHREVIAGNTTAYEFLYSVDPGATIGTIRGVLGNFLFSGDDVHKRTEALSGGEAARLVLAKLVLQHGNVLVLDEPSNHLDMESIESFIRALEAFDGTVLLVSHNRYLVDRVATRILELRPKQMEMFDGNYQEFLEKVGTDHLAAQVDLAARPVAAAKPADYRETKQQKKKNAASRQAYHKAAKPLVEQSRQLEAEIARLEAEIATIEILFADPRFFQTTAADEVRRQDEQKQQLEGRLADCYNQWETVNLDIETLKKDFNLLP